LEIKGFHAVTANDPAAGYAAAKEHHPSLITLDVMMPEGGGFRDGFDLLEKLRNDPEFSATPIIMISALGSDDDIKHGMDLGATRYMAKHETVPDMLIAAINELLGAKK
jgi:DNA-binding response OmpR family regulator